MASLDLSVAFEVVNIRLLLEHLTIVGLPPDVFKMVDMWQLGRHFYICLDGSKLYVLGSSVGTVQSSILRPNLFSLFISPLLDLAKITLFADDNQVLVWNKHRGKLFNEMSAKLTKLLKDLGLKVNESKRELCLFHR